MTWIRATWSHARGEPLMVVAAVLLFASTVLAAVSGRMAYDAQHDVASEVDAREAASCDQAHAIRTEQEQLLLDIAVDLDASPRILDLVRRRFAALPDPASCQP